ncbi:MAG: IclR family transcriptional regulator, partial [Clostridia bacterium]|nr:IclR family transcriptional regulator [Deltaproteobacteria bacterium]
MMRGVQRTVAVFDCFKPQRLSLTLQEISDSVRLPKSTTFRVVQSLEQTGYLIRLEDQKYCLSFRFTRLAGMVMSTLSIRQVARPLMFELARQTNETITLNMATGRDRVCIDVIDSPSPLMSLARPGQHVRLDGKGATGKILMAHLATKDLRRLIGPAAKATARNPAQLVNELARIKNDGYCVSDGERVLGLSAIAAPVRESDDTANYC